MTRRNVRNDQLVTFDRMKAADDPVAHVVAAVGKAMRSLVQQGADPLAIGVRTVESLHGVLVVAEGTVPKRVEPSA